MSDLLGGKLKVLGKASVKAGDISLCRAVAVVIIDIERKAGLFVTHDVGHVVADRDNIGRRKILRELGEVVRRNKSLLYVESTVAVNTCALNGNGCTLANAVSGYSAAGVIGYLRERSEHCRSCRTLCIGRAHDVADRACADIDARTLGDNILGLAAGVCLGISCILGNRAAVHIEGSDLAVRSSFDINAAAVGMGLLSVALLLISTGNVLSNLAAVHIECTAVGNIDAAALCNSCCACLENRFIGRHESNILCYLAADKVQCTAVLDIDSAALGLGGVVVPVSVTGMIDMTPCSAVESNMVAVLSEVFPVTVDTAVFPSGKLIIIQAAGIKNISCTAADIADLFGRSVHDGQSALDNKDGRLIRGSAGISSSVVVDADNAVAVKINNDICVLVNNKLIVLIHGLSAVLGIGPFILIQGTEGLVEKAEGILADFEDSFLLIIRHKGLIECGIGALKLGNELRNAEPLILDD